MANFLCDLGVYGAKIIKEKDAGWKFSKLECHLKSNQYTSIHYSVHMLWQLRVFFKCWKNKFAGFFFKQIKKLTVDIFIV